MSWKSSRTSIFKKINVHRSVHRNNILIYVQQEATLHRLFYLETALRVSGGTSIHHQQRKQLYLQHLVFVRPLVLSTAIVEGLNRLECAVGGICHPQHTQTGSNNAGNE